jgi:hypothetical protein
MSLRDGFLLAFELVQTWTGDNLIQSGASMGLPELRDSLCNTNTLTHNLPQSSRKSEKSGKLARRKRRTNERPMKSVPEPLLSLRMVNPLPTVPLLQVINNLAVLSNSHPSATNLARKSLANTKLPLEAFNSSRSTATVTCSTLDTPRRHMVHHPRCIANVITTLIILSF